MRAISWLRVGASAPWVWISVASCSADPRGLDAQTSPDDTSTSSTIQTGTGSGPTTSATSPLTTSSFSAQGNSTLTQGPSSDTNGATVERSSQLMWDELTYPCSLRNGGDVVFVCDRRQFLGLPSQVLTLPKSGGESTVFAELAHADAIAVNESVWVLDAYNEQILRLNLNDGSVLEAFAAPYFTSNLFGSAQGVFATSYEGITWFSAGTSGGHTTWSAGANEEVWLMDADAEAIYFTVNPPYPADPDTDYRVMKVNVDFATGRELGEPVELANGRGSAKGIAVTAQAVIFADNRSDVLFTVAKDGGEPTWLADVPTPWSLGVDDTHVYIASRPEKCTSGGAVYRVPLGGGEVETIADQQVCPSNVLVTESEVFWLNAGPEQPDGDPSMVSGSYSTIMRAVTRM